MATPVPFANRTFLEWGNGSRVPCDTHSVLPLSFSRKAEKCLWSRIESRYLSYGTRPAGSTWAMMPLPYSDNGTAAQFEPPCEETVSRHDNDTGICSGRFPWDVSIIDALTVPSNIAPGEYVLGFRWGDWSHSTVTHHCWPHSERTS